MMIGETLGLSLEKVTKLSVLEIQLWSAYFDLKAKEQKRKYGDSQTRHRN
jgi:hypothetical protein